MADLVTQRCSVAEYHRFIEAGILNDKARVELLEEQIVPKARQTPAHAWSLTQLGHWLLRALPARAWVVRIRCGVTLADSEPEPDLAVVDGPDEEYLDHHPRPGEIALVIEIADSTLADDREQKARIYARAGLPAYWIVNVVDGLVEVYTDPVRSGKSPHYRTRILYPPEKQLPVKLRGKLAGRIPVQELLP